VVKLPTGVDSKSLVLPNPQHIKVGNYDEDIMKDDRKRQVKTTKLRYGKDFYEKNGRKPHNRGFSDPEQARAAALKGHEMRRLKRLEEKKSDESTINSQEH
jgi:hypothetical protein